MISVIVLGCFSLTNKIFSKETGMERWRYFPSVNRLVSVAKWDTWFNSVAKITCSSSVAVKEFQRKIYFGF